jgi:Flp pilus assembly protein TadG
MMVTPVKISLLRMRGLFIDLIHNRSGNAAVEFAMIVPLMLALFFGTLESSSGVAVDRKVTLVARTLSDLTSQSTTVTNTDLANYLTTGGAIMTPYSATPLVSRISELYIDPVTNSAKVQWSKGSGSSPLGAGHCGRTHGAQNQRHLSDLFRGRV